jgi:3-oxoacyl-[acyl-carrier-protein] synthase III
MTAIVEVSSYLPAAKIAVEELGPQLGVNETWVRLYQRLYGFKWLRYEPGATATDLMLASTLGLSRLRGREQDVRYVIHARTIELVAPYPLMQVQDVARALSLDQAVAFAVTQHSCASGLLAVSLAGRLLSGDPDRQALALVLTGEKAFSPTVQMIPEVTLMSEGAAAVLVAAAGRHDRVIGYSSKIYGEYGVGLGSEADRKKEFDAMYVPVLARTIEDAVDSAHLTLDDISLILPHNVNRITWVRVCKHLGVPVSRVFLDNIPVIGHNFCADTFLNYRTALDLGRLDDGDRYVMASVGLGGFFSAMVFERLPDAQRRHSKTIQRSIVFHRHDGP